MTPATTPSTAYSTSKTRNNCGHKKGHPKVAFFYSTANLLAVGCFRTLDFKQFHIENQRFVRADQRTGAT